MADSIMMQNGGGSPIKGRRMTITAGADIRKGDKIGNGLTQGQYVSSSTVGRDGIARYDAKKAFASATTAPYLRFYYLQPNNTYAQYANPAVLPTSSSMEGIFMSNDGNVAVSIANTGYCYLFNGTGYTGQAMTTNLTGGAKTISPDGGMIVRLPGNGTVEIYNRSGNQFSLNHTVSISNATTPIISSDKLKIAVLVYVGSKYYLVLLGRNNTSENFVEKARIEIINYSPSVLYPKLAFNADGSYVIVGVPSGTIAEVVVIRMNNDWSMTKLTPITKDIRITGNTITVGFAGNTNFMVNGILYHINNNHCAIVNEVDVSSGGYYAATITGDGKKVFTEGTSTGTKIKDIALHQFFPFEQLIGNPTMTGIAKQNIAAGATGEAEIYFEL